jgi:hypothetical protein
MHRQILVAIVLASLAGARTGAAAAQSADTLLRVSVAGAAPRGFTLGDLEALGTDSARGRFHDGAEVRFTGVPLGRVIEASGGNADSLRGRDLSNVVLVEAADGYRVAFALAELDPSFRGPGEKTPLLVWAEDGAPVAARFGPLRIVVPGERRPSRWIRQVTKITVSEVR